MLFEFPRRRAYIAAAAAILVACVTMLSAGVSSAAEPVRAHYDFRVDLNMESTYLTAVETVSYTNSTSATLASLVFNVPAAHFGGFSYYDVTVNGEPVRPLMDKQSLEIPLPRSLAPGGAAEVVLHFRLEIPPSDGRYGAGMGVIGLSDWYPMLAIYKDGWQRIAYSDIGDPFVTETADYDVFLVTSSPATVLASGETVSHNGRQWHFRARLARDFGMAASARYSVASRQVGGITVTVAYLPEHAGGAARSLDTAAASLQWYSNAVGQYPYSSLSIVELVAQRNVHTAQEHSGLISMRSDIVENSGLLLDMLTAHEVAHQWFFGIVGSDQVREPWLDEGLVNAMALDYFRDKNPEAQRELWPLWGNFTNQGYLNRSIYDYPSGTAYFDAIYRRGATFVRDLQVMMGVDVFYRALREYVDEETFRVAGAADFLLDMRAASASDPIGLYRRTFDYPYLVAADPVISLTVPSRITASAAISLPVTAVPAGARFRATMDGQVVPADGRAIAVPASALTLGSHVVQVEALGPGTSYARKAFSLTATQPEPTPTPTRVPPPVPIGPIATATPAPGAVRLPLGDRESAWLFLALLGGVSMLGMGAAALGLRNDKT